VRKKNKILNVMIFKQITYFFGSIRTKRRPQENKDEKRE
jgi:hypothetical protein